MMLENWGKPNHSGMDSSELFKWFDLVAKHGVGTLFEPFDHLGKVYQLEDGLSETVEILLPNTTPMNLWNGNLKTGLAVRSIINETIYTVGQAAKIAHGKARLKFEFNSAWNSLTITDESIEVSHAMDNLVEKFSRSEWADYVHLHMENGSVKRISASLSIEEEIAALKAEQFGGFIPKDELAGTVRTMFENNFNGMWSGLSEQEQNASIRNIMGYNDVLGMDNITGIGIKILTNAISPNPMPIALTPPSTPTPAP